MIYIIDKPVLACNDVEKNHKDKLEILVKQNIDICFSCKDKLKQFLM